MIIHKLVLVSGRLDYLSPHQHHGMGRDLSVSYEIWDIKYCNVGAPGQSWWEFDWLVTHWLTYQATKRIFPPSLPPSSLTPSSHHPASCGGEGTVVNFSIAEEATSSQLAADWLVCVGCRSGAGCIESNCFASIEDLWSHWESDCGSPQTSALVVLWDSGEREDPELDWQCCMTDMQARPDWSSAEDWGVWSVVWLLSQLHSV